MERWRGGELKCRIIWSCESKVEYWYHQVDEVVRDQLECWAQWLRQGVNKVYSGVVRARSCIAEVISGRVSTLQDCHILKERQNFIKRSKRI